MELIAGILIASLVSEESLRFRPIFEQESDESCALAATASLLSLYCGIPATEAGLAFRLSSLRPWTEGGATLGDILLLLADAGLRAKAFWMDPGALRSALASGYLPLLLRYEKPRPHFALLIGAAETGCFALADPARGLEVVSEEELGRRWGGAALLVDRAATSSAGRSLAKHWSDLAFARFALLREGAAAGAAAGAADRATAAAAALPRGASRGFEDGGPTGAMGGALRGTLHGALRGVGSGFREGEK